MITLYIKGTKKVANEAIAEGNTVVGVEYTLGGVHDYELHTLKQDAVIKFYTKLDPSGNPIAKSYGNWKPKKNKIV